MRLTIFAVYGTFLLETLQICMSGADSFYWFASGFGNMAHLANPYLSPFDTPMIGSLVSLIVQLFFCYRIYVLSKRKWWICAIIASVSFQPPR